MLNHLFPRPLSPFRLACTDPPLTCMYLFGSVVVFLSATVQRKIVSFPRPLPLFRLACIGVPPHLRKIVKVVNGNNEVNYT